MPFLLFFSFKQSGVSKTEKSQGGRWNPSHKTTTVKCVHYFMWCDFPFIVNLTTVWLKREKHFALVLLTSTVFALHPSGTHLHFYTFASTGYRYRISLSLTIPSHLLGIAIFHQFYCMLYDSTCIWGLVHRSALLESLRDTSSSDSWQQLNCSTGQVQGRGFWLSYLPL